MGYDEDGPRLRSKLFASGGRPETKGYTEQILRPFSAVSQTHYKRFRGTFNYLVVRLSMWEKTLERVPLSHRTQVW